MPQPMKGSRYGGSPAHHKMMMANLTTELIRHGRLTTTHAKAKTVQPLAEKMVTFAKRGDVHSRRQVLKVVRDQDVVNKLFHVVGPAFAERDGGYTRVLKTGPRKGDYAPMALIEFVEGVSVDGEGELEEQPTRRWSLRRRKGGTPSATAQRRSEERAAAVDRGEEPEFDDDDLVAADAVPVGTMPDSDETPDHADDSTVDRAEARQDDDESVQADPAEVEARLAAEDDEPAPVAEDESTATAEIDDEDEK